MLLTTIKTLNKVCEAIKNKWPGMLSHVVIMLHNKAALHVMNIAEHFSMGKDVKFGHAHFSLDPKEMSKENDSTLMQLS